MKAKTAGKGKKAGENLMKVINEATENVDKNKSARVCHVADCWSQRLELVDGLKLSHAPLPGKLLYILDLTTPYQRGIHFQLLPMHRRRGLLCH